jgi:hypothetical protein
VTTRTLFLAVLTLLPAVVTAQDPAAELLAFEREVEAAIVRGDVELMDRACGSASRCTATWPSPTGAMARLKGGDPERQQFDLWFERVYAKRDGRWQYLSHRTVDGPHFSRIK